MAVTPTPHHEQVAHLLLEAGASLQAVSKDNFTMLMAASVGGLLSILEKVLPQSDVNAAVVPFHAAQAGYTALMYAAQKGHEQCARVLIKAGADLEAQQTQGATALMAACQNGHDKV